MQIVNLFGNCSNNCRCSSKWSMCVTSCPLVQQEMQLVLHFSICGIAYDCLLKLFHKKRNAMLRNWQLKKSLENCWDMVMSLMRTTEKKIQRKIIVSR